MPRKTKELDNKEEKKVAKKAVKSTVTDKKSSKASTKKGTTTKASTKKSTATKTANKKETEKEANKTTVNKKTTTKKVASTKATAKKDATKVSTKTTKSKVSTTKKVKPEIVEYYDLPLSYDKTVVKILYQTPTTLFVYWEISKNDVEKYRKNYGENFFETTKPVLIVHNDTLGYSFEIDINDFANSWYFNVNDSKSIYRVELGRRPLPYHSEVKEKYIYISSSNTIESPNDKIMFEKYLPESITFKNIKNNEKRYVSLKEILKNTSFANNISNLYNIKIEDLYKAIYQNENTSDLYKLMNPSSNSSSF